MRADPDELRRLREARALTQEGLALKCGLSRKTIQRMERGDPMREETLAFVAGALGVALPDFTDVAGRKDDAAPDGRLGLRRVRSGKHILNHLAQTDVGRIECDVDADGEIIAPLTALVTQLQGLMRETWGAARPPITELPLLSRLQVIADINDNLERLARAGVGLFMGHYYRYAVGRDGATGQAAGAPRRPIVLTRLHLTRSSHDRLMVPIDAEWRSSREPGTDLAPAGGGYVIPADEELLVLYPTPSLASAADDDSEGYIDTTFVVRR
ncbi:MAG TPA: helix-turn-helix transcriptional regulator [Phenylobacterium sp.]|jgi:transcriptional regulator with XRE-family HTH domain